MAFSGAIPQIFKRAIQSPGNSRVATLSAGETIDRSASTFQILNPNGSNRTIVLPTTDLCEGWSIYYRNSGTSGNLVINDAAAATIVTLAPGYAAWILGTGTSFILPYASAAVVGGVDLDGNPLVLDADGDTSITADTDDQIDIALSGADDFQFTANTFTALSGSTIATDTLAETTAAAGVTIDGLLLKDGFAFHGDNTGTKYGNSFAAPDIAFAWDGTRFNVTQGTVNSEIRWGVDGAGIDQKWYTDTASESFTLDQSADALVMTAAVSITGQGSTVVPVIPIAAGQALAGSGAVNITSYYTSWDTTGGGAGTLANGAQKGQLKKVQLIVDGGDGTLTPTSLSGGAAITFADVGDFAILCWNGTAWVAIELGNDADGATAPVLA